MNTPAKSVRIQSLDVFRALTMLLMLWVNEYAGVKDLPHWMYHAAAQEDMMGFSDIIFPAFLFAMGMAVPFAVQNRLKKGDSLLQVSLHILLRTVALVVMGLFTVNKGAYDPVASGIPSAWYSLLMVAGFFLVWNLYPKVSDARRYLFAGMKIAGIALLIYLLVIFVPKEGQSFGTKWWGILGLIGWSYLGTSLIYLATRSNLRKAIAAFLLLTACCLLTFAGVFRGTWAEYIPSQPVLYTLSVAGMLSAILIKSVLLALAAAYAAKKAGKISLWAILAAVAAYQIVGSLAEWGLTGSLAAALQDLRIGLPGIAVQILGGYAVLKALQKI